MQASTLITAMASLFSFSVDSTLAAKGGTTGANAAATSRSSMTAASLHP
jgi:hypothetical protein